MKSKSKKRKGLKAKKYNLGGYFNPNGDPTDPKKKGAVAESTAVPNYVERAFLNYAGLMPQLQTPYFRDEGTIRPTPENEPSFLQSIWEGTPLGQTEDERLAPLDQMSLIDVMAQPLKALDFYSFDTNRGRLPTRAEWDSFGSPNPMDNALFMYNPAAQISFATEDEAGGLSAFTGIGKIGKVVRDAFNTGDDLLKITSENISKQGKKITQRQLSQEINRTPVVDIEEALYNPEIYGVEPPKFGSISRNESNHYLGQNSGPLSEAIQKQHAEDYGISDSGFALRHRNDFNITKDGVSLPITRNVEKDDFDGGYYSYNFSSGSVPQIKPLQRGGELEKFVRKDGTVDLKEVSRYVENSKSISPADRFILSLGLSRIGSDKPVMYDQFKQFTSQFIPRSMVHTSDKNASYGAMRLFNPEPSEEVLSKAVVISEGDLPTSIETEAGAKLSNYLLNGYAGKHYDPVQLNEYGGPLGNHSHYRVVQFPEREPEISYFLEIQSDGLSPQGDSRYNKALFDAKKENMSMNPRIDPVNIGDWERSVVGLWTTNGRTPIGKIRSVSSNFDLSSIIENNPEKFPGVNMDAVLRTPNRELGGSSTEIKKAINSLGPEEFNEIFKKNVEPTIKINLNNKFSASSDPALGNKSSMEFIIEENQKLLEDIKAFIDPAGQNIKSIVEKAGLEGAEKSYYDAANTLRKLHKNASNVFGLQYESIQEAFTYVQQKYQEFGDFKGKIDNFHFRHNRIFYDNQYLDNALVPSDAERRITEIHNEIYEIENILNEHFKKLEGTRFSINRIRKAYDVNSEDVFPINPQTAEEIIDRSIEVAASYADYGRGMAGSQASIDFIEMEKKLTSARMYAKDLSQGNPAQNTLPFSEVVGNLTDLAPLEKRYNNLLKEYEVEVKKFADKYLPAKDSEYKNPVSQVMKKRPEKRIINEALHGEYNNLFNRFPTEETSRKIQGHGSNNFNDVHKKYKNLQKTLKSMGYESKMVTDKNGNTWWEVKATAGMLHGTAEYDAYWKGGRIGLNKKRRKGKFGAKPVKIN